MRIEVYFQYIQQLLTDCAVAQSFSLASDKRSTHEGYVRAEVYFVDGSTLHLREFVDVEVSPDRLTYVYQYMDPAQLLVFRYDNTGHHKKLGLPTHPHHKHDASERNVVASAAPDLADVLKEIEGLVALP